MVESIFGQLLLQAIGADSMRESDIDQVMDELFDCSPIACLFSHVFAPGADGKQGFESDGRHHSGLKQQFFDTPGVLYFGGPPGQRSFANGFLPERE